LKLHSIRKKLRGWSINLKADKKHKVKYQSEIQKLQLIHEVRALDNQELDAFRNYQIELDNIYLAGEQY
jgi:hypothetical protein